MELGRYHIKYEPRAAVKGQVLAYFIAEFTDDSTGTTKGQLETTVAPDDQTVTLIGGKRAMI